MSNDGNLEDLVAYGIKCSEKEGAEYADVKYMGTKMEEISYKNENIEKISRVDKRGIGIRCIVNKSWGFASTNELTREKITELAKKAVSQCHHRWLPEQFLVQVSGSGARWLSHQGRPSETEVERY